MLRMECPETCPRTSAGEHFVAVDLAALVVRGALRGQDGCGSHTVRGEAALGDGLACMCRTGTRMRVDLKWGDTR